MTRSALPAAILGEKVIPVARGLDEATAPPLAEALLTGGLSTLEVTVEDKGGLEAIAALADGRLTVGAGTVTSIIQAESAVTAGASFLVSPHTDPSLIEWARINDVLLIPGGMTPTEIAAAWSANVPAVKLFPASTLGPGFVRSLLGPYPELLLIPTGGVDDTNVRAFLEAGATAVGVGGWLTNQRDLAVVTHRAQVLCQEVV